ncbi:molybdenum cofactor biosynthesis protein MoaE [Flavobacterium sp. WV_118_3]|jgi:molybdopterin synthase catalytic subunit|uniref:molybdenum cofactor biosynthesis protein MoaE n=1 Tax=Flavobacterium sp. WV_118_3 TaxID=3151764 RepID=UPI0012C82EAF|nr:molybdenum cofactor biosynthesis protein MoaE [Flavobacterium sp.]HRB72797.1 molybdenum cofactor biosynthesis protein MoaE [Flavobacterium sp.]
MKNKQLKNSFIEGPISPEKVAKSIAGHLLKTHIGGHSIFLGQVRNDSINGKTVASIEFSAYTEMAEQKIAEIREAIFARYDLVCMHVYHSLGLINTGELCFFVFTSSQHRKAAIQACNELVERIKAEVPIWGKEIFEDESYHWKVNRQIDQP